MYMLLIATPLWLLPSPAASSLTPARCTWRRRKAILTEDVKFTRAEFDAISPEAKDFVRRLLSKDPAVRPTAKEALEHPWLKGGTSSERSTGGRGGGGGRVGRGVGAGATGGLPGGGRCWRAIGGVMVCVYLCACRGCEGRRGGGHQQSARGCRLPLQLPST